jgi:hypothetical protein
MIQICILHHLVLKIIQCLSLLSQEIHQHDFYSRLLLNFYGKGLQSADTLLLAKKHYYFNFEVCKLSPLFQLHL